MIYTPYELVQDFGPDSYHIAVEQKLTAAERRALPDDAFGLPKKRKYPLVVPNEEEKWSHLKDSIAYFHTCKSEEDKKELAKNIAKVIRENNIKIKISPNNKIRKYANFDGI